MSEIKIKTESEIVLMREAGKILAQIMQSLVEMIEPGVATIELDLEAEALCKKYKVEPAFKGYQNYPSALCVGVNDVVVHGIPNDEPLKVGDIVSLDMGVIHKGFHSDHAVTVGLAEISESSKLLLKTTREALHNAIDSAVEGKTTGDIGNAIQTTVEAKGFSVVREMVGHGIGRELHEPPQLPGFGSEGEGQVLKKGMTLAIEAIINEGGPEIKTSQEDGWTTRTKDGRMAALFEHTILVGKEKAEILTEV